MNSVTNKKTQEVALNTALKYSRDSCHLGLAYFSSPCRAELGWMSRSCRKVKLIFEHSESSEYGRPARKVGGAPWQHLLGRNKAFVHQVRELNWVTSRISFKIKIYSGWFHHFRKGLSWNEADTSLTVILSQAQPLRASYGRKGEGGKNSGSQLTKVRSCLYQLSV